MATLINPQTEWWKTADPSVGGFLEQRFDPAWFAAAKQAPTPFIGSQNYGIDPQNPWKPGDLNYYEQFEQGDSGTQTRAVPTALASSPIYQNTQQGQNYEFEYDAEGNPTSVVMKLGDKAGQRFSLQMDANGQLQPIPSGDPFYWDTNGDFADNWGWTLPLLGAAGAWAAQPAAGGSTAAASGAGTGGAMAGTPQLGLMQLGADPALLSAAGIDMGLTNAALTGATGGAAFPGGASLLGSAGLDVGLTASALGGASGLTSGFGALAPTAYNATLNSWLDPVRGLTSGSQAALDTVGSDAAAQAALGGSGIGSTLTNLGGAATGLLKDYPWLLPLLGAAGGYLDSKNQPTSTGDQWATDTIRNLQKDPNGLLGKPNFQMSGLPAQPNFQISGLSTPWRRY